MPGACCSSDAKMRTLFGASAAEAAVGERKSGIAARTNSSTFPSAVAKFIPVGCRSIIPSLVPLKHKFQSELHLPRRAGIARRKARVADPPEGLAANDSSGLAETCMIEEV